MPSPLANSYRYCERTARREAGNFYLAFRLLPRPKRLAMCALYAFFRMADDLADQDAPTETKRQKLALWREQMRQTLEGRFSHPLHAALYDAVSTFRIPGKYLEEVLDGVVMDLDLVRYKTFADLYPYCYRVASAVGLACLHIWGFSDENAKKHAEAAGIAFQMTNILRDLDEDAKRGRVYLPQEDLQRFQYAESQLQRRERNLAFTQLMRFEVERTKVYYDQAWPLLNYLDRPGRAVFLTMARTYHALLKLIEDHDYDVFSRRVRLSTWRKAGLALQALPIRWGWI
ncbi:MAG: phytoene/squalene synthase family protein [Gemmataceae bacterium]